MVDSAMKRPRSYISLHERGERERTENREKVRERDRK